MHNADFTGLIAQALTKLPLGRDDLYFLHTLHLRLLVCGDEAAMTRSRCGFWTVVSALLDCEVL